MLFFLLYIWSKNNIILLYYKVALLQSEPFEQFQFYNKVILKLLCTIKDSFINEKSLNASPNKLCKSFKSMFIPGLLGWDS